MGRHLSGVPPDSDPGRAAGGQEVVWNDAGGSDGPSGREEGPDRTEGGEGGGWGGMGTL